MISAKEIREKCKKNIEELQKICNHPSSTWCEEQWAIGHSTGRQVKCCDSCEKVLETK